MNISYPGPLDGPGIFYLAGGFKDCLFSILFREDSFFD